MTDAPTLADQARTLEQLVGQFASPYDFLRELVQNAMDAGSDLVDVELHEHPGDHATEVVYELAVIDAGAGMDEAIIDGELTRLFGTSKTDDRTMAGGFGIGFVSVFAWEPERVLVQTGRQGEAWELQFDAERTFEKHRVEMPLEGTVVRLFRRGVPAQRERIADAVLDSLERWCRFVPIEVTFEDMQSNEGRRRISASFEPEGVAASVTWSRGATRAVLALGPEPEAVLLRQGLVLEEGRTHDLLPRLTESVGRSAAGNLVVRVDSPDLQTGLARDGVVESRARRALESELAALVDDLRGALTERIAELVRRPAWSDDAADTYSFLHAHLQLQHRDVEALEEQPILRLATGTPISIQGVRRRARLGAVAVVDSASLELRLIALRSGIPVLQGRWSHDRRWMVALLERSGLVVHPLDALVSRAEARPTPQSLARLLLSLLSGTVRIGAVQWGELEDAAPGVLGGVAHGGAGVVTGLPWTDSMLTGKTLWLRAGHPVVEQAERMAVQKPDVAALGLAVAVLSRGDAPLEELVERWRSFA